jgi:hypothetical protein
MLPTLLRTYLRGLQPIIYVRSEDPQELHNDLCGAFHHGSAYGAKVQQCAIAQVSEILEARRKTLMLRQHVLLTTGTLSDEIVQCVARCREDIHFADVLILTGKDPALEAVPVGLRHAVTPVDTEVPPHAVDVPRVDVPEDLPASLAFMQLDRACFKDPPEVLLPALQGLSRFELLGAIGHIMARGIMQHNDRVHYHLEYAQEYRARWERV